MQTQERFEFRTSGVTGRYCKDFEIAGKVQILSLVKKGRDYIDLSEIYDLLEAETAAEKNGIQWAVQRAKEKNIISSSEQRGRYIVVR